METQFVVDEENKEAEDYRASYARRIEQAAYVAWRLSSKLPYHNFRHAVDVYSAANVLAHMENVSGEDRFLLKTASLFHDVLFQPGYAYNEELSAKWAGKCLPHLGYSPKQVEKVKKLVLATKLPTHPENLLERIMCDADLDNLGRDDFFDRGEALRQECGWALNNGFYENQKKFLQFHQYYTQSARNLRDEGKRRNLEELERRLK
ncbi:phosphohydrolase [Candidatus Pacearchaeota archaeon]|nr:phosphohydrolase [Candidatus Pacearchaeota archaeon]